MTNIASTRTKSGFTLAHRVEPFDQIFGEPFSQDHPWADIGRGSGAGRRVHIAATGHTNHPRVHILVGSCTLCERAIPSTCTKPMRVTWNPLRATCRRCLGRWALDQGWQGGGRLIDAIVCWRVYGARFQWQLENGYVTYDPTLRLEREDKNLPWAMRGYFKIVNALEHRRQQEAR